MNTKIFLLAIVAGILLGACALAQPVDQTSSGTPTRNGTARIGGMSVTEHTSSGAPTPNGTASSGGTSVAMQTSSGMPTPNGTASSGGTSVAEQTPSGTAIPNGVASSGATSVTEHSPSDTPTPNGATSSGATSVTIQTPSDTPTSNGTASSGGTGVAIRNAGGAPATNALYVVQGGDSLEKVAQKYGVPVEWIVQRNLSSSPCLKDGLNCRVGRMIFVPRMPTLTIEMPVDGSDFRDLRVTVMNGINQYRRENKLPELAWDEALAAFTQSRSVDMAKRNYFAHFDPVTGAALADGAGRTPACENIFAGGAVQTSAVPWWINSPAHRTCMLRDYAKVIGVGVSKDAQGIWYVTMIAAN